MIQPSSCGMVKQYQRLHIIRNLSVHWPNILPINAMNLLLYMAPIAFVFLLPAALVMEPDVIDATISLTFKHRFMWLLLLVNSTMAYAANLTNFLVTKNTSALTLQTMLAAITMEVMMSTTGLLDEGCIGKLMVAYRILHSYQ